MRRKQPPAEVIRSEEELDVATTAHEAGRVRARKVVEHEQVEQVVPVAVEHAATERVATLEGDSGQVETLPDGSMSIPVFEERLVVEKRLVVRERIIIRKHTVYEDQRVTADLARERVEIEAEESVGDRVLVDPDLVDPDRVDPRQVDPRQVDPRQVDPRQVDSRPAEPRPADTRTAGY